MNERYEYQQALDGLRFTPEQKAALADRAVRSARQEVRRRRPVGRVLVIAAVLAVVLAVGAGASGVLKSAVEAFAPIFGGSAAQTEIIDKIGYPIGAGDTDNGVTITADAIMGDAYSACIVYTVSRDDGTALLPEGITARQLMLGGFGGSSWSKGGSHGSSWFLDEDPSDNAIQYVETVSSDEPLTHGTATAEFENLCYWDDTKGESVPLVEGRWKFRFDVDYEDSSITLSNGETFQQGGMTFTVDEVRVSPIAVRVAYTVDSEVVWSNAPSGRQSEQDTRQMQRCFENVEILLTRTDGTVLDLSNAGGSVKPENGATVCSKGGVLDEITPLEELESISVGGIVYPIPKN